MDRNLGASQVAKSHSDELSFGDLYQWGRGSDGHQVRTSSKTNILSNSDSPGNSNFIVVSNGIDWRSTPNDNLWQGVNGINNPCLTGFRLPTESEWMAEINTWISKDLNGAFASPLKLPAGGYRFPSNGVLGFIGVSSYYSSSSFKIISSQQAMRFNESLAEMNTNWRADGSSVRCIKD
jgi:hypothetical protein